MKYTAINIGPIVKTLDMARSPRDLWVASFLFSHLMRRIYEEIEHAGKNIVSPAKATGNTCGVGLYPDRIFFEGEIDIKETITNVRKQFAKDLECNEELMDYFNIMTITCEVADNENPIAVLNQQSDVMELCQYATDGTLSEEIYKTIIHNSSTQKRLFALANADEKMFATDFLNLASCGIAEERTTKSFQKYFCIVQADGDNIGKTIANTGITRDAIKSISDALVKFGADAANKVRNYGGMPIYAGGDDLLFIAPLVNRDEKHIFTLIDEIENTSFDNVRNVVDNLGLKKEDHSPLTSSLSFGIAITYHKYPLYEALEAARTLLFGKAKRNENKKSVAWTLRKHSGGSFDAEFSRADKVLWNQFLTLIDNTTDGNTVSAVAHKIRQEEALVNLVVKDGDEKRLDAMFEKLLEFDTTKSAYFNAVKALMPTLRHAVGEKEYIQTLFSLLRTAKFIKGEEQH